MLKSAISYLKHSSNLYSLLGNMVFTLFSFATFLLMVRLLGKDEYGRWVIYVTAAALLDMLRLGLTGTAAIRLISTSSGTDQKHVIAASYHLSMITTLAIGLLFAATYFAVKGIVTNSYYLAVLIYYPFLAAANLPYNQAITLGQGFVNFKQILIIRGANGILTFLFIGTYIVFISTNLAGVFIVHIAANLITSFITIYKGWDGMQHIRHYSRPTLMKILNFGKYSTASYIGSNLLRSSDTIIISLSSAMGAASVAIYAIPLKFVELAEIPLRSFTATAFPKLSNAFTTNKPKFNHIINLYMISTTLLLMPALLVLVLFPDFFLHIIGGHRYTDSIGIQRDMVYILAFYILLLPLDRYSGVALFAIDKPAVNFYKIMVMLAANIIFDVIAVFVFQSLLLVVVGSVLFTLAGINIGWGYIHRATNYSIAGIPHSTKEILLKIYEVVKKYTTKR